MEKQQISQSCSGSFTNISNATCHCEAFSHAEMAALDGVQLEVCSSPSPINIYPLAHILYIFFYISVEFCRLYKTNIIYKYVLYKHS